MITISVNAQEIQVAEGQNLLVSLRTAGIPIPALCFHPALKHPTGACRCGHAEISLPDTGRPHQTRLPGEDRAGSGGSNRKRRGPSGP